MQYFKIVDLLFKKTVELMGFILSFFQLMGFCVACYVIYVFTEEDDSCKYRMLSFIIICVIYRMFSFIIIMINCVVHRKISSLVFVKDCLHVAFLARYSSKKNDAAFDERNGLWTYSIGLWVIHTITIDTMLKNNRLKNAASCFWQNNELKNATCKPSLRCVYTFRPRLRSRSHQVYIVLIVMGHLTGRMGSRPVTIGTIIKRDGDGIGDEVAMCKQAFILKWCCGLRVQFSLLFVKYFSFSSVILSLFNV